MSLHPVPIRVPSGADDRLSRLARGLFDAASDDPGPPDLVGVVDLSTLGATPLPAEHPDHLVLAALTDPDPVAQVLGFVAPAEWWAVGIVTGARALPLDADGHGSGSGSGSGSGATFVHLLDRDGTSVSVLSGSGSGPTTTGPQPDPVEGRMADACRRMLRLPTAPPPGDMTTHVVDLWLARVTRAALTEPGLDWPAVVARNPAHELDHPGTTVPTPAATARRTLDLGTQLDWDRYRLRCVDAGGTPFGELEGDVVAWMDAGMFARWMLGECMSWPAHLDLLDGLLSAGAVDRLWATLALCPAPAWPPRRSVIGGHG